jgi:hypothetical protein
MLKMKKLYWALAAAAAGLALDGSPASAATTTICTGSSLPAGTYVNVLVPSSNPSCSLEAGVTVTGNVTDQGFLNLNTGAVVQGNLTVGTGATLRMLGGTVDGNVYANNALKIVIASTVDTNVVLIGTTGGIQITTPASIGNNLTISGTQSGSIAWIIRS